MWREEGWKSSQPTEVTLYNTRQKVNRHDVRLGSVSSNASIPRRSSGRSSVCISHLLAQRMAAQLFSTYIKSLASRIYTTHVFGVIKQSQSLNRKERRVFHACREMAIGSREALIGSGHLIMTGAIEMCTSKAATTAAKRILVQTRVCHADRMRCYKTLLPWHLLSNKTLLYSTYTRDAALRRFLSHPALGQRARGRFC